MTMRIVARKRKRGRKKQHKYSNVFFHIITNHIPYSKYKYCSNYGFSFKSPCMNIISTHVRRCVYAKVGSPWLIVAMVNMLKAIGWKQKSHGQLVWVLVR